MNYVSYVNGQILQSLSKFSYLTSCFLQDDEQDMEVDTATSAVQTPAKHSLPELEIYCYLLVLIFLIDQKKYDEV